MDDGEWLQIELDYWDDAVGAFEPAKVVRQVQRAFPDAELDPTDHQRVRLLRELELWAQHGSGGELGDYMVAKFWELYQTNGPSYRYVVPFPSGHRVSGSVWRFGVGFKLPAELPPEHRQQLLDFLLSLRMGEPTLADGLEDA